MAIRASPQVPRVPGEPLSALQPLLDNPFALLLTGLAVPTLLHAAWSVVHLVFLRIAG